MVVYWAEQLVQLLMQGHIIEKDEQEIYLYCIQTMLFRFIVYGTILLLSFFIGVVDSTIVFYFGFLLIRYTAGGYHANSHRNCYVLSIVVYLVAIGFLLIFPQILRKPFIFLCSICIAAMIYWAAPVDHKNRPFSPREKERYKKQSYIITTLLIIGALLLSSISTYYAMAIVLGAFNAACSVVIGQRQRKKELKC